MDSIVSTRPAVRIAWACLLAAAVAHPQHARAAQAPCALLTPDQASAAVHAQVGAGQPIGTTGCSWSTMASPDAKDGHAVLTLSVADVKAFTKSSPVRAFVFTPVGGLGDDAVFIATGPFTTLSVKKGQSCLVLRVYGVHDQARQREIEKSVATDALARW